MTVVRELITLLGFTVDKASYNKAQQQYDALQGKLVQQTGAVQKLGRASQQAAQGTNMLGQALGMVQRFAAQAGLTAMVKGMVDLASNANETSNVIESVFGKDKVASVEAWAEAQGAAMGRSRYSLQSYAAQLGAVLGPVTDTTERAQEMSQGFAQLAVDLGSFFNTTDEDAMRALRSGLTGEYESLKKYGVVLNDATLQEIAAQRGIKKKITQMTVAEKTELRYAAIMKRTEAAQGDATKTIDGFANSTKAFHENLKDLKTDMGKAVLPQINKLLKLARQGITWFNEFRRGTNLLEAAMWTLAAVAGVLAVEFYGAFILPAVAVLALIVLVDELMTLFRGGKTAIAAFINSFAGEGAAESWVLSLIAGFSILREEINKAHSDFMSGWGNASLWEVFSTGWVSTLNEMGMELASWADKASDIILSPFRAAYEFLERFGLVKGPAPGLQKQSYEYAAGRGMGARIASPTQLQQMRVDQARDALLARRGGAGATTGTDLRGRLYARRRSISSDVSGEAGVAAVSGAPSTVTTATGAAAGGGAASVVVNNGSPIINVNGGDPAAMERAARRVIVEERKKTAAALGGRGRS